MTGAPGTQDIGELLRELAPEVLGALVRRYGRFGACETRCRRPCSRR